MFGLFGFQESKQEARGGSPEGKKKEKIMKKSCKIFSAIALSAILAMGTAIPAFANTTDEVNAGDATNATNYNRAQLQSDGAHTNVNIATYSSNYSVTVPLYAPFLLDTAGGQGMAPSNYYIQNNGQANVYVNQVDWAIQDDFKGKWTFGANKTTGNTAPSATAPMAGGTAEYGSFVITLSANNFEGNTIATIAGTSQDSGADGLGSEKGTTKYLTGSSNIMNWTLVAQGQSDKYTGSDPSGQSPDGRNNIDLEIRGTSLAKSVSSTQTAVAQIMYTISSKGNVA